MSTGQVNFVEKNVLQFSRQTNQLFECTSKYRTFAKHLIYVNSTTETFESNFLLPFQFAWLLAEFAHVFALTLSVI